MGDGPKKNDTNWDFKVESPEAKASNSAKKATDRLKTQALERKEANPNLKIEKSKASGLSRTKLAQMEAKRGLQELAPISTNERLKSMGIDLGVCFGLWIASKSFVSPVALMIIAEFKAQNLAYIIEKIPMFAELVRIAVFLVLYFFVMFLPAVITFRTIGKMIMKCRVEHEDGGEPARFSMLIRESLGKFLTIVSVVGLVMGLVKERRFLHDKMFKTMVTK